MKNSHKIRVFVIALVALFGLSQCVESDLETTFQGPHFVRFTDTTLTYRESFSQTIPIRVHNAGPQLSEPISVSYVIGGTAREGRDYTIEGTKGVVVIPAKQSFGTFNLKLINNANNILDQQSIVFTLTNVRPANLQLGLGAQNPIGRRLTFTLQDDCLMSGQYTGSRRAGTVSVSVPDIDITSLDCRSYTVANWNIGIPLFSFDAVKAPLTFVDNGDNTLTIPVQSNGQLGDPGNTLSGTGSWNPRTRQISLAISLKLQVSDTKDTTIVIPQLTYTPQ